MQQYYHVEKTGKTKGTKPDSVDRCSNNTRQEKQSRESYRKHMYKKSCRMRGYEIINRQLKLKYNQCA